MLIGLTNDDGIDAPGIRHLAGHLVSAGFDVVVCAPDIEFSGAGASTGADLQKAGGIEVVETSVAGVPAFRVSGPPAVCALLALRGMFDQPIGFLVSGINAGTNMGPSVLHSGTVGAVVTAANFGVPGLAVSLDTRLDPDHPTWDAAATLAEAVIRRMLAAQDSVLVGNLNVPAGPLSALRGLRSTVLDLTPGFRSSGIEVREELGEGRRKVAFVYEYLDRSEAPETDVTALLEGYASLSWLRGISCTHPPTWAEHLTADVDALLRARTSYAVDTT